MAIEIKKIKDIMLPDIGINKSLLCFLEIVFFLIFISFFIIFIGVFLPEYNILLTILFAAMTSFVIVLSIIFIFAVFYIMYDISDKFNIPNKLLT